MARSDGLITDVSPPYPGATHDKTLWNKVKRPKHRENLVLGDKAYAGGLGEGEYLLRPIKRGETAYKQDKPTAKEFNRRLSRIRVRIEHVFARLKTW